MKRCSYCGKHYPDNDAVCPVDATPLDVLPESSSPQVAVATAPQAPEALLPAAIPAREALVTLFVIVVCLAAQKIPLPTLAGAAAGRAPIIPNSIFVLGVQPVLSGFIVVELAALLVPALRPLRTGGRSGREKLRHTSLIVGMVLAVGQAFFVALALERTASSAYGAGLLIITVSILLGATAVLIALARVVDEGGLGGGFPVLSLAFILPAIAGPLGQDLSDVRHGFLPGSVLQNEAVGLAFLVGATLWLSSAYSLPGTEPEDHPALLSRPACGLAPLSVVVAVLTFRKKLFALYAHQTIVQPWQVDVVVSMIAAIGFAYLFNLPERVSVVWKALSPVRPERPPRLKPAFFECVVFIGLVVLVDVWLIRRPGVISVIFVTGIIIDLIYEWRAKANGARLVPIWEVHQVYAVPPAMRLLEAQGFHPFAKGLRLRSLLQFFGPYVPVVVLVPAEEAQAAYALLERRWPVLPV
jgi:SecY